MFNRAQLSPLLFHILVVAKQDRERIMEGCCKMVPSLRHAEVVSEWAGLRPARDRVLVSLEYQQV